MDEKPIEWRGGSHRDLCNMPESVRRSFGFAVGSAQSGRAFVQAKTLSSFNPAVVVELLEDDDGNTYRAVYTAH